MVKHKIQETVPDLNSTSRRGTNVDHRDQLLRKVVSVPVGTFPEITGICLREANPAINEVTLKSFLAATNCGGIQESTMGLEEKVKQLQEEFDLPKVLIKMTLRRNDVNGDLVKAKKQLQKFRQSKNRPGTPTPKPNWKRKSKHSLPSSWVTMPRDERGNAVTVHLVDLENTCSEYQDVEEKFRQTVPHQNACIVSIGRIQNPFLYQVYQLRKQKMDKDNGGDNERLLFHGTNSDNITKINTQGFDRGFSGAVNGARYGNGVYFARDASYSKCYTSTTDTDDIGVMYLARVLVGRYCRGSSTMKKPPPKNPQRPEILFDSLVDRTNDPSIFVVYYDNQCYPEYLITFLALPQ